MKALCGCWTNRQSRRIPWCRLLPQLNRLRRPGRDRESRRARTSRSRNRLLRTRSKSLRDGNTRSLRAGFPALASEEETRKALEKAFDYRGDVTITRKDGSTVEGYLFDRKTGPTLADSLVRVLPRTSNQRVMIAYSDIAALAFTGRDTAAGKSWEAWVKKYVEKKAAGEKHIGLEPESLE